MDRYTTTFLALSLVILAPITAQSELLNCSGIWTNSHCDKEIIASIDAAPQRIVSEEDLLIRRKKSLLHELTVSRLSTQRRYDIRVSDRAVHQECLLEETSLERCRELIEKKQQEIVQMAAIAASEKKEEDKSTEKRRNETPGNIAIVNFQEDPYWRRRVRGRYRRPTQLPVTTRRALPQGTTLSNTPRHSLPPAQSALGR